MRIVDALWAGEPPSSAAKLVQLYVSHLRNKLGREAIETVPSGYRMQIAPLALDCVRFEQLLREGRAAQTADNAQLAVAILTRALALWRGPALVDVSYDEFAAAEAARLDEAPTRLFRSPARSPSRSRRKRRRACRGGQAQRRTPTPRAATRPPHDRSLPRRPPGRGARGLPQARDSLIDELGLEPGADLRAVELGDPPPRPCPCSAARSAGERRAGDPDRRSRRWSAAKREIRDLRDLVLRTDIRLVTLVGAGGSGKTRLALALASESQTVLCERHHDRRAVRSTRPRARPAHHRSGAPRR